MCALQFSVTYNVMSDVLTSFQTKTLLVSGAYMKIRPRGQWKRRSFTGPKPQSDLRDGRNFGIFHTVSFSPSLCSSCMWSPVSLSFPPSCLAACEDLFSLVYFYQAKVHWRQQRYQPESCFSVEILFFLVQIKLHFLSFTRVKSFTLCTSRDLNDLEKSAFEDSATSLAPS